MSEGRESPPGPRGRSRLRVVGLTCVGLLAVYLASVSTYQIVRASLFPHIAPTQFDCRSGTRALYQSVEAARLQVAQVVQAERDALMTYRSQLDPIWQQAPAVRALCEKDGDQAALQALRSVELLRYAEERAVRYSAIDLTKWRKRTPELVDSLHDSSKKN